MPPRSRASASAARATRKRTRSRPPRTRLKQGRVALKDSLTVAGLPAHSRRRPHVVSTPSGRPYRRARSRRRRRAETRWRLQAGAAVACDERPQLDVRAMRVVALQPGPDPRLVVPAVERWVLRAGEDGLELLERRQGIANEPPHGPRVRGLQRVRQLQGGPRLSLIDPQAEADVDG